MKTNDVIKWTQNDEYDWKRWDSPVLFLDVVLDATTRVKLTSITDDGVDERQLVAVIRTARRLAHGSIEIAVGSVHPILSRLESVRQTGDDVILSVFNYQSFGRTESPPIDAVAELGGRMCALLHIKHKKGIALSVCGRHKGRMVLAQHHIEKWCLENKNECPHWNENE